MGVACMSIEMYRQLQPKETNVLAVAITAKGVTRTVTRRSALITIVISFLSNKSTSGRLRNSVNWDKQCQKLVTLLCHHSYQNS